MITIIILTVFVFIDKKVMIIYVFGFFFLFILFQGDLIFGLIWVQGCREREREYLYIGILNLFPGGELLNKAKTKCQKEFT